jgi:hypothetical protein
MPLLLASALKLFFQLSKLAPVLPHLAASAAPAAARNTAAVASPPIQVPSLMLSSALITDLTKPNVPSSATLVTVLV